MYKFEMTIDDSDTLYEVLSFYVMHHKKFVNKLQEKDRDDLSDDDFILVNTYHNACELRDKFEAVDFARPNLFCKPAQV